MKLNNLFFILILIILFAISCKKNKKEEQEAVKKIATEFLSDFYYNDLKSAKKYGNKSTADFLDYIEKNDKEEYRQQYFNKIDSVKITGEKLDSAFVYYVYENSYNKTDHHVLPLLKMNGQWTVNIQNKNNLDFYRLVFDYSSIEIKPKNYFELSSEELLEIELFMNTFIKQINHPKLVVGLLSSSSLEYYDIEEIDYFTYNNNYSYNWRDLSTLSLNSSFSFNYENVLFNFQYFISNINQSNSLGVIEQMELILTDNYGQPFNSIDMEEDKWYKSLRWFVKGKNEIIELINNEDNTITLQVVESEPINNY